jgi:hypothetical protein
MKVFVCKEVFLFIWLSAGCCAKPVKSICIPRLERRGNEKSISVDQTESNEINSTPKG